MGRGSYQASDWVRLKNERKLSQSSQLSHVFDSTQAKSGYLSRTIRCRESRDSDDASMSTPVILGFDVTASMGYLAKELAVHALNRTVTLLLQERPITDPQILCSAVGDSQSDQSPLQVTQFESDIRIIQQLTELYPEGGGGGNHGESYHLLWYFAARHTRTDCFEKRRKKGYLFTVGDDRCHPSLSPQEIRRVFGDDADYPLSNEELLREAQEKYHTFHIHIAAGRPDDPTIQYEWRCLMPGHFTVIPRNRMNCLAELIYAVIAVTEGKSVNQVLRGLDQSLAETIAPSVALIEPPSVSRTISF